MSFLFAMQTSPPPAGGQASLASGPSADSKDEKKVVAVVPALRTNGKPMGAMATLPPPIEATPRVKKTFRFAVSTNGTYQTTLASLLGACGGTCTIANSKVQPWASSVRVRRLTVWPPGGATGNYTFIDWASSGSAGFVPDTAKINIVPDGVVVSSALRFVPPKGSLAGNWLNPVTLSTSSILFGGTYKIGSIVDLDIEFTLSNVSEAGNITVAAATLGNIYYLALDGPSSNKIVPQGVPTTA